MLLLIVIIVALALLFYSYRSGGPNEIIWVILGIVLLLVLLKVFGLI